MRNIWIVGILFLVSLLFLTAAEWNLNHPLNDESVYARAVNMMLTTGKLGCEGCTASSLVLILYGTALSAIFGYSITILRLGAIVLGAIGIALTYALLVKFGAKKKIGILISLLLLANPLYYSIARLFMTDIMFFVLVVLAVLFYETWKEKNKFVWFAAACIVSALAVLTRQIGLVLPVAFAINSFAGNKRLEKKHLALLALPLIAFVGFSAMKFLQTGVFYEGGLDVRNPVGLSQDGIYAIWGSLAYLGFLLLPLFADGLGKLIKMDKKVIVTTILLAAIAVLLNIFISPQHPVAASMPYLPNTLNAQGIGALTLVGASDKQIMIDNNIWYIITAITLLSTAVVLTNLLGSKKSSTSALLILLLLMFALLKRGVYFDRYTLLLMPFAAALLHNIFEKKAVFYISIVAIILLGSVSIYGSTDYMKWNDVRWNAIDELNVSQDKMNGGFEYCFYNFGYEPIYSYWKEIGIYNSTGVRPHDWKFCKGDDYMLSFSKNPQDLKRDWSYSVYKTYNYCTPFNYCGSVYVLKRGV